MGCSEVEQEIVTELDISGCGIADLTGIENFSNLKKLNCAENRITDLSPLPDTDIWTAARTP
ncbi:MAG: leucine-rich repeat domain-containing protein [Ruminococcus sp.]